MSRASHPSRVISVSPRTSVAQERLLTRSIRATLPNHQAGFGLLGLIVGLALSAAVVGVAYSAYRTNQQASDVSVSTQLATDVGQKVLASYASAANFSGLSTQSAALVKIFPASILKGGQPVNAWGGAINLTPMNIAGAAGPGNNNGFALTFEQVPSAVCASFALHGGQGFYGVNVNNTSVMTGNRVNVTTASALCNHGSASTVQFVQAKTSPNGAQPPSLTPCVAPPDGSQNVACPAGQLSSIPPYSVDGIAQTNHSFCTSPYGPYGTTPWQTVSNTCVPQCVAPAPVLTPQTQAVPGSAACPAGQTGSDTWTQAQSRTQTVTYTCATLIGPLNTNPATYSAWVNTGGKIGEVNTCAPTCATRLATPPWAPQTKNIPGSAACPPGQLGSDTWTQAQSRSASCANPAAATDPVWGGWGNVGGRVGEVNTCAPQCVAPPPSFASRSVGCPAGQTGSITQQQTTSYSCPAPTGNYTSSTGPWTTVSSSCAPVAPPPPTLKYGACMVVSPNGPDVNNVLYDLSTGHIVETAFDASISLTPAQLAETKTGGGFCPDSVTIYYGGTYPSANGLAAGYPSSDYLSQWLTYPDPSYPNGPVW